jgi:putative membrane protein
MSMPDSFTLASLNAFLNAVSATCAFLGYRAIRRKDVARHRALMLAAFTASCVFLISYVTRMTVYGDTKFAGEGAVRIFYFGLLISHVLVALISAPLVITTLTLGLRKRFDTHRRFARITFPMWVYVSVTGVLVYWMLWG